MTRQTLELVSGKIVASASFGEVTYLTGDNKQIKPSTSAQLLAMWANLQAAGSMGIRGFGLHDQNRAFKVSVAAADVKVQTPQLPISLPVKGDVLIEAAGSATTGDVNLVHVLNLYKGASTQNLFCGLGELRSKFTGKILTQPNTLSLGTTGDYSGEESIVSEADNFDADFLYALVGYKVSALCGAIGYRLKGGTRFGGPGDISSDRTKDFFVNLSRTFGDDLIPVLDPLDRQNFLIDGVQDENGTDTTVESIFAQLKR